MCEELTDPVRRQVDEYLSEKQKDLREQIRNERDAMRAQIAQEHSQWKRLIVATSIVLFGGSWAGTCSYARDAVAGQVTQQTEAVVHMVLDRAKSTSGAVDLAIKDLAQMERRVDEAESLISKAETEAEKASTVATRAQGTSEEARDAAVGANDTVAAAKSAALSAKEMAENAKGEAETATADAKNAVEQAKKAVSEAKGASKEIEEFHQIRQSLQEALEQGTLREQLEAVLKGPLRSELQGLAAGGSLPIGSIVAWPAELADGRWVDAKKKEWHVCDGSQAEWNDTLGQALRGRHGNPDADRFEIHLPDFRGYFLRGYGRADNSHKSGELGVAQDDSIAEHTHDVKIAGARLAERRILQRQHDKDADRHEQDTLQARSSGVVGAEAGPETRPINKAVNWVIRVR